MKRFGRSFFCVLLVVTIFSCKKENASQRGCWMLIDFAGNEMATICNKTEAELIACVQNGSCGVLSGGATLSNCNYFKIEGERGCWEIGGRIVKDLYENQAKLYARCFQGGVQANKVDCANYCHIWYTREKRVYRPTNGITYSHITASRLCADALVGIGSQREKVIRSSADSIIYLQYSLDGINW